MTMVVGLDLGQSQDFSALGVVELVKVLPAGWSAERDARDQERFYGTGDGGVLELRVRHLQRWQLGTPYDVIVDEVSVLMRTPELVDSWLVFDATGVGRAVKDMLWQAFSDGRMGALPPVPRTITGEGQRSQGGTITKRDLMSVLQVALQQGRLKIAQDLPLREVFEQELRSFRLKISAAGRDTYEFQRREGAGHGDLTIAVALAASQGGWVLPRVEVLAP